MLKVGDVLFLKWPEGEQRIGEVLRIDGDESCFIKRTNGVVERWNVRSDEDFIFPNARVERGDSMKTKNDVTNTTEEARVNPALALLKTMGKGIEETEARGQRELVRSEVLPIDALVSRNRTVLEAWGVDLGDPTVGNPVEGDILFCHVKLPEGWKKVATDHHMWSNLVDDKGRVRARIFYKAAFYDRKANIQLCTRYRVEADYAKHPDTKKRGLAKDTDDVVLFDTGWVEPGEYPSDAAREGATSWLNENKPGWEDPTKYWEEP